MRARLVAVPLAVLALVAGACGRITGSKSGGIDHPTGADQLVLRVDTAGGFVPPSYYMRQIPELSLYGDGRVITPGPQIEIYPGPSLPNVLVTPITEDGIQAILEAAEEAGLMGPDREYTTMTITDAPTTVFTLYANGEKHLVSVYALGEAGPDTPGMSEEEAQAREALAAFRAKVTDLASWLPAGSIGEQQAYDFTELRIYVQPYTAPDQGLQEPVKEWPLDPLASFGDPSGELPDTRCGSVTGDALATLLPDVRSANELTPWASGGSNYLLLFRPLLPDEHGCEGPGAGIVQPGG